jgi:hypothetical protein
VAVVLPASRALLEKPILPATTSLYSGKSMEELHPAGLTPIGSITLEATYGEAKEETKHERSSSAI